MNIPFLETSASNFSYVVYGNKCVFIDFVDDFFHFAVFQSVDDARNFFILFVRVGAFYETVSGIASKPVVDGLDKQFGFLRDDFIRLGSAETFFNQMDDFRSDEISDSRKERTLQAKDKGDDNKDKDIQE